MSKMIYTIICASLLLLISCDKDEIPCIACLDESATTSTNPFTINEVSVSEQDLVVSVSYTGGCENHVFDVDWPEVITLVYPPDFGVTLYHDNRGDSCEAYLTEELRFPIKESGLGLSDQAIKEMRITVINSSNPKEQVSNR